jgi:hypothetical protein
MARQTFAIWAATEPEVTASCDGVLCFEAMAFALRPRGVNDHASSLHPTFAWKSCLVPSLAIRSWSTDLMRIGSRRRFAPMCPHLRSDDRVL